MKSATKTILIVFITIIAALAIVLVFKGITNAQFIDVLKKISLVALILIVLSGVFTLFQKH